MNSNEKWWKNPESKESVLADIPYNTTNKSVKELEEIYNEAIKDSDFSDAEIVTDYAVKLYGELLMYHLAFDMQKTVVNMFKIKTGTTLVPENCSSYGRRVANLTKTLESLGLTSAADVKAVLPYLNELSKSQITAKNLLPVQTDVGNDLNECIFNALSYGVVKNAVNEELERMM